MLLDTACPAVIRNASVLPLAALLLRLRLVTDNHRVLSALVRPMAADKLDTALPAPNRICALVMLLVGIMARLLRVLAGAPSYDTLEVNDAKPSHDVKRIVMLLPKPEAMRHKMDDDESHAVAGHALPALLADAEIPQVLIPTPRMVREAEPVAGRLLRSVATMADPSYDMACVRVPALFAPVTTTTRLAPAPPAADRHTTCVSVAQHVDSVPVCPMRAAHEDPPIPRLPDRLIALPVACPALVDSSVLGLSYDTPSDPVPKRVPTVTATRTVPPTVALALHITALLDCQVLASHPVAPTRVLTLPPPLPYPPPATTSSLACSPPALPLRLLDTTGASKLAISVRLPAIPPPHVTTTPDVPSDRLPDPAIPTTLESDCHAVASLAVCAARTPPLLATAPVPLPSTTTDPPLATFTRPSPRRLVPS